MREFNEILADATDRRAFANGASWDRWSWQWCQQCVHDRDDDCPRERSNDMTEPAAIVHGEDIPFMQSHPEGERRRCPTCEEPCTHCADPEDGEPAHAGCPGCACPCSLEAVAA